MENGFTIIIKALLVKIAGLEPGWCFGLTAMMMVLTDNKGSSQELLTGMIIWQ